MKLFKKDRVIINLKQVSKIQAFDSNPLKVVQFLDRNRNELHKEYFNSDAEMDEFMEKFDSYVFIVK